MEQRICSVTGCAKQARTKGMCNPHYQRWYRKGETDLQPKMTFEERFWSKVDKGGAIPSFRPALGPCWIWTAATDTKGYGKFFVGKIEGKTKLRQAYRVAYELEVGPIPEGLDLDHLCRVRLCVNPLHLEPVTHRTNVLRGEGMPARGVLFTRCPKGHPYDEENTYWYGNNRKCRKCRYEAGRRHAAKKRAARGAS